MAADELVTAPQRLAAILNDMNHHLLVVNVRIDSDGPLYASSLIRLDADAGTLFLDELHPEEGHQQLAAGQEIRVYASLRGIAIRFSTRIVEILEEGGIALYSCAYPTQMRYLQRREIFRVNLPISEHRGVKLRQAAKDEDFSGRIVDLSAKGFCLDLNWSDIAKLEAGTRFRYSDMELPSMNAPLSGEAVLINTRPMAEPGRLAAGFCITGLDATTERSLMRATLHYQREARKTAI